MNQVYVALWDGDHYLITRKRVFNSWWGSNAVVVLSAEAMVAVLAICTSGTAATEQQWNQAADLLSDALRAADSVARDGERSLPQTGDALAQARDNADRRAPIAEVALQTLAALELLYTERPETPPPGSVARTTVAELSAALQPEAGTAPDWAVAQVLAARLVVEVREWSDAIVPVLVNQAGQWSLPGGGRLNDEWREHTARREFAEELGIWLSQGHAACDLRARVFPEGGGSFSLVRFRTTPHELQRVADLAARNTRGLLGSARPAATAVSDWEVDTAVLVATRDLRRYLGVRIPVSVPGAARALARARRSSQAIDWYGAIAALLAPR